MWGAPEARSACFNEAEAVQPRRGIARQTGQDIPHDASMRPRLFSLGEVSFCRKPRCLTGCFNEAEAVQPRRGAPVDTHVPAAVCASMRPRLFSLGEVSGRRRTMLTNFALQ